MNVSSPGALTPVNVTVTGVLPSGAGGITMELAGVVLKAMPKLSVTLDSSSGAPPSSKMDKDTEVCPVSTNGLSTL